jgi:hypothetical protein
LPEFHQPGPLVEKVKLFYLIVSLLMDGVTIHLSMSWPGGWFDFNLTIQQQSNIERPAPPGRLPASTLRGLEGARPYTAPRPGSHCEFPADREMFRLEPDF